MDTDSSARAGTSCMNGVQSRWQRRRAPARPGRQIKWALWLALTHLLIREVSPTEASTSGEVTMQHRSSRSAGTEFRATLWQMRLAALAVSCIGIGWLYSADDTPANSARDAK